LLVFLVGTPLADKHFFQRQSDGLGLPLEQFQPDAMHGDTLKMFVAGCEQRHDFMLSAAEDAIQRQRGVLPATPAKNNFLFHADRRCVNKDNDGNCCRNNNRVEDETRM
jgi:hypothetical protein